MQTFDKKIELLRKKTIETLGFDPVTLPAGASNKVCVRCKTCGEEFLREYKFLGAKHHCSYTEFDSTGAVVEREYAKAFPRQRVSPKKMIRAECKLIHPDARLPFRKRTTDAGYDIFCIEDVVIKPHGMSDIRSGLIVSVPPGYYFTVDGRSGMSSKGVIPTRGIIDATYCGELKIALVNFSDVEYHVQKYDRIAQIILHEQQHADFCEVKDFGPDYNQRGTNGFSSSGR